VKEKKEGRKKEKRKNERQKENKNKQTNKKEHWFWNSRITVLIVLILLI
jgi:cytoskeletal protein RodZ